MFGRKKIECQQQMIDGLLEQISELRAGTERLTDALEGMRISRNSHEKRLVVYELERDAAQAELQKQRLLHKAREHEVAALLCKLAEREDKLVGMDGEPRPPSMNQIITDIAKACGPGVVTHMGMPADWVKRAIDAATAAGHRAGKEDSDYRLKESSDKWSMLEEMLGNHIRRVIEEET